MVNKMVYAKGRIKEDDFIRFGRAYILDQETTLTQDEITRGWRLWLACFTEGFVCVSDEDKRLMKRVMEESK